MNTNTKTKKTLKRLISLVLAMYMLMSMTITAKVDAIKKTYENIKVGLICIHDEDSTYDNNFIQAIKAVQTNLGLSDNQVLIKTNISECEDCYYAAVELAEAGCDIIFANSFGHETYMIQAAKEFENVQFCHATGTQSHIECLDNYHNAFAAIYEGRFLSGVAAGMKLNEMIDLGMITAEQAVIGYIGTFGYAEDISAMTAFFLGARYICPSATMKVVYTYSWYDIARERESALNLINSGCVLISQYSDSVGAPSACEEKGVSNVAYNISTNSIAPTTALISSKIDWSVYFKLAINAVVGGEDIPTDYCGTMKEGAVKLTKLNDSVAAVGTQDKIDEIRAKIESGELKVFDTSTFTVNGERLTTYMADVLDEGDFQTETEAIENGTFTESSKRSAPYFDIRYIDGINDMNKLPITVYSIVYSLVGGTNNSGNPISYTAESDTITLKAPFKDGYTFNGWYRGSERLTKIAKGSTGNITLTAKWTPNKYTIKFNGNGSTSGTVKSISAVYDKSVALTANSFKKKGYKFTGWNKNSNGLGAKYANKANVKNLSKTNGATVTLYAQWSKVDYTITYKLNKGKNNSKNPKKYNIATSTITLKNPTRSGYKFVGWYSDAKFKKKATKIAKGSTGNKIFYAKWGDKIATTIYTDNSETLKPTGNFKGAKWSSSDKKVVTVNNSGKVVAKKAGKATITAKTKKATYKCTVTVKKPSLSKKSLTLTSGKSTTIKINGGKIKSVKTSNKSVVAVTKSGKITAKKAGKETITFVDTKGRKYACKVKVVVNPDSLSWNQLVSQMPSKLRGTTINVCSWNPVTDVTDADKVIKEFEKQTGIKVRWRKVDYQMYDLKIAGMINAGIKLDLIRYITPDPARMYLCQDMRAATGYDFKGAIWDSRVTESYSYKGKLYAANLKNTFNQQPSVVIYRPSQIKRYKLDDPYTLWKSGKWTYDNFKKICRKYKKEVGHAAWMTSRTVDYLWFNNIDLISFNTKTQKYEHHLSSPAVIKGLQECIKNRGDVSPETASDSSKFEDGTYLFETTSIICARKTDFHYTTLKAKNDLECVPFPTQKGKTYYTNFQEFEAYGIPKGASNPEAVYYYLRYYLDRNNYNEDTFFSGKHTLETYEYLMNQKNYNFNVECQITSGAGDVYGGINTDIRTGAMTQDQVKTALDSKIPFFNKAVKQANNMLAKVK